MLYSMIICDTYLDAIADRPHACRTLAWPFLPSIWYVYINCFAYLQILAFHLRGHSEVSASGKPSVHFSEKLTLLLLISEGWMRTIQARVVGWSFYCTEEGRKEGRKAGNLAERQGGMWGCALCDGRWWLWWCRCWYNNSGRRHRLRRSTAVWRLMVGG